MVFGTVGDLVDDARVLIGNEPIWTLLNTGIVVNFEPIVAENTQILTHYWTHSTVGNCIQAQRHIDIRECAHQTHSLLHAELLFTVGHGTFPKTSNKLRCNSQEVSRRTARALILNA